MLKTPYFLTLLAPIVLVGAACGTAHADRIAEKPVLTIGSSVAQSPYSVELVGQRGELLNTYTHRGRFYVEGDSGSRYAIRISNPTNSRVEAVVSVDGLDVIDGETASFRAKRGYIVPARGNLVIEGFRTSTQAVAAFRFSSVKASYASRKGKARNVGVVGVAIFAEKAQPVLILPSPQPRDFGRRKGVTRSEKAPSRERFDLDEEASSDLGADAQPSPSPGSAASRGTAGIRSRPRPPISDKVQRERSGLGTAFGERRQSNVSFTRFERANPKRPTAVAELRYNNASGLRALGIRLNQEFVDQEEIATRESATSFPDSRFASPPQ